MKRKSIYLISAVLIAAFVTLKLYHHFSGPKVDYLDPKVIAYHFNNNGFVGSTTCMECHQEVYESHILTPHFNTSAYATLDKIKASFEEGKNTLSLLDANLLMTTKNGTPFQHAKLKYGDQKEFNWRMDIVIGSGSKGQSYLSQQPEGLYQLQASYYVPSNSWINSPNYTNRLNPLRAVNDQCLKCHITFAKNLGPTEVSNKYDINKMVMGIDCERCHGPGQQHVITKRKYPQGARDTSMVQMASLSRQQRLDLCASCHSGLRNNQIKNPFKFLPGDTLSNYSKNYHSLHPSSELDVHGNQYGLLTSSKCFTESTSMDCITCHDPHKNQRGDHSYFNAKCMQCHNKTTIECSIAENNMDENNNCIQCHMPVIPSKAMQVQLSKEENTVPVGVRTHYIAIYNKETDPQKN